MDIPMSVHAVVITVGSELVSGLVADTNSAYLSRRLAERGIITVRHESVDDRAEDIAAAIRRAAGEADVVIVAGGLGPTADDLTREGLALAMGCDLHLHAESWRQIEAFFRRRGYTMSPANRSQAMVPDGAEPLTNPVGTAPGIYAEMDGARILVVPGVPSEMRHLTDLHILPRLADLTGDGAVVFRSVHAFGLGESIVGEKLADLMARDGNPLVGTTVTGGVVTIRVTARGGHEAESAESAERTVEEIRRRLGPVVFGVDEQTLPSVVGSQLIRRGRTLSVAESCTGGLIGKLLTDAPGASGFFAGGVLSYANEVKQAILGVPRDLLDAMGAVSEPVAEMMARGTIERFTTTYALAVTGIAGPDGGTADKPVGLVYTALASPTGVKVQRNQFAGGRDMIRLRAALTALNMLRLAMGPAD
jgi:nicotinamide-nucleotide amidase